MKFEELDLSDDILDALDAMNFSECTPIQQQAIPLVLEGRDMIATAQTGTGKTAAYLLPVIDIISNDGYPQDAINCLVMAPTRELAQQIDRQMEGFAYYMPVSSLAIYGGTDGATYAAQQRGLKSGADVVIATPGRLIAHMSMGYVDLSKVGFFILDEADRMLDMGFYDDIIRIASFLPKERQTLMFSATMPPKIKQLAAKILNDPAEVKIAVSKPADGIDQSAYICHEVQKPEVLKHLFRTAHSKRVIVFASSKLKVKDLCKSLRKSGFKVSEIHSDLDQDAREEVLLQFKAGHIDILVATDILARGIDIDDISMVVNYDVPHEAEDYVHRIGRTARAGGDGKAVTLVSEKEQRKFGMIESFLGKEVRKDPLPENLADDAPEYRPGRRRGSSADGKQHGRGGKKKDGPNHARKGGKPSAPKADAKPKAAPQTAAAPSPAPQEGQQPAQQQSQQAPKSKRRRYYRHRGGGNKPKGGADGAPQQ